VEALTVVCVEAGDFLGRGHEYVRTLASMCRRHLPEHRFVVLSDQCHVADGIDCILDEDLPHSFWAKVHLFRPGCFTGNILYLDLDVVIHDSLAHLVSLLDTHDFWMLDDFAWPISRAEEHRTMLADILLGGWGTCNSSVMLWRDDAGADIWNLYRPGAAAGLAGDQNWITKVMGERIKLIPPGIARSYKLGPKGPAPITVMHGLPKPHEVGHPDWH
jgi:hypothetical protein